MYVYCCFRDTWYKLNRRCNQLPLIAVIKGEATCQWWWSEGSVTSAEVARSAHQFFCYRPPIKLREGNISLVSVCSRRGGSDVTITHNAFDLTSQALRSWTLLMTSGVVTTGDLFIWRPIRSDIWWWWLKHWNEGWRLERITSSSLSNHLLEVATDDKNRSFYFRILSLWHDITGKKIIHIIYYIIGSFS